MWHIRELKRCIRLKVQNIYNGKHRSKCVFLVSQHRWENLNHVMLEHQITNKVNKERDKPKHGAQVPKVKLTCMSCEGK